MKIKFLAIFLILAPLVETLFLGRFFGLEWHSPEMMARLSAYLSFVKIGSVVLGIYLFESKIVPLASTLKQKVITNIFRVVLYLLGLLQIGLCLFGFVFSDTSMDESQLSYLHKEKSFGDTVIYVNTIDPGTMGSAYHYFYLKCPKPNNRYSLVFLKRLNWMRNYDFIVNDGVLLVTEVVEPAKPSIKIDLTDYQCP